MRRFAASDGEAAKVLLDGAARRLREAGCALAVGPMNESDFQELLAPPGQAGEIVVCGDHVLRGYLAGIGDGETKIRVADRIWHRTGDAGWQDVDGRIWLLGRAAEKLPAFPAPDGLPREAFCYPFAAECALREMFPNIRMAALDWDGRRTLVVGGAENEEIGSRALELGIDRSSTWNRCRWTAGIRRRSIIPHCGKCCGKPVRRVGLRPTLLVDQASTSLWKLCQSSRLFKLIAARILPSSGIPQAARMLVRTSSE